jgi:HNH endonuclease
MTILSQKLCLWCGDKFETIYDTKVYCQRSCKERAKQSRAYIRTNQDPNVSLDRIRRKVKTIYIKICKNCGETIYSYWSFKTFCDDVCSDMATKTKRRAAEIKRIKKNQVPNIAARIYYRDKGLCGICKDPIDLRLQYPDLQSLSIDHIVPVSLGGTNLQSNLQPSHLICNSKRGNKPLTN